MVSQKTMLKAVEVCELMNKTIDKTLPNEITKIIKTHAILAAAIVLIPDFGLGVFIIIALLWTMYFRINNKLDSPASVWQLLSSAFVTNILIAIAITIISSVLDLIFGVGQAINIVVAVVQYAVFIASGCLFLEALIKFAKKNQVRTNSYVDSAKAVYAENKAAIDVHGQQALGILKSTIFAPDSASEIAQPTAKGEVTLANEEREREYVKEYKLCLEEGGEISSAERRLLNRLRSNLNITEERAVELEKL